MADKKTDVAAVVKQINFNEQGLVPVIAQHFKSGEVLMMAWMNADAIRITLDTKDVTYWSRSRRALWRKGESSGHTQKLVDFYIDCDGDTLLLKVDQAGPACHTGEKTCFFNKI